MTKASQKREVKETLEEVTFRQVWEMNCSSLRCREAEGCLTLLHFFFLLPLDFPLLKTPRGFLGHWWQLSELKRWLADS